MKKGFFNHTILLLILSLLTVTAASIQAEQTDLPQISIIIDDIGYRHIDDANALMLPGPITYAILPHSPYAEKMSVLAHASGKDVILHLPMEAIEHEKNRMMGPGGLESGMDRIEFVSALGRSFRSFPNIIGVNNHMGSRLTMDRQRMEWLMDYLNMRKVFYIDSLTSHNSVASIVAGKKKVPYLKRDVFLDNEKDRDYITAQFYELIAIAKRKGKAIAIGHPHPETIEVLAYHLDRLNDHGVILISLQDMLELDQIRKADLGKVSLK